MTHLQSSTRGQALIEFSLCILIFSLFLIAFFEVGRMLYTWSAFDTMARNAATQGAMAPRTQMSEVADQKFQEMKAHYNFPFPVSMTPILPPTAGDPLRVRVETDQFQSVLANLQYVNLSNISVTRSSYPKELANPSIPQPTPEPVKPKPKKEKPKSQNPPKPKGPKPPKKPVVVSPE